MKKVNRLKETDTARDEGESEQTKERQTEHETKMSRPKRQTQHETKMSRPKRQTQHETKMSRPKRQTQHETKMSRPKRPTQHKMKVVKVSKSKRERHTQHERAASVCRTAEWPEPVLATNTGDI